MLRFGDDQAAWPLTSTMVTHRRVIRRVLADASIAAWG
jgi:hypothetical protein